MIYSVDEFNPKILASGVNLLKRPRGQRKKSKYSPDYLDIVGSFDIETSTVWIPADDGTRKPHSFMYIWQYQIGSEITVTGRTWDEFLTFTDKIKDFCTYVGIRYNVMKTPYLVTFVHNLAYEWAFLSGIWDFQNKDCFFKKERKPLYCKLKSIEFRDSLAQSNMSLAKFAENMGCQTRKQSGQRFDYTKVRYPWTRLSDFELLYCIDDVITLEEAIRTEMKKDGDTLYTLPLTSTGYVRRDCKLALLPIKDKIQFMLPMKEEYKLLRRAFRGGNTHCNRWHCGKVVENVWGYDIRSSYPTQQLTEMFPMDKFKMVDDANMLTVFDYINKGYAVCADFSFKDIRLKDKMEPMPYLALGCCDCLRPTLDNGRILHAKYLETTLTEWDLLIVLDQYEASNIEVGQCMVAKKDYLPLAYRNVIMKYYKTKTELKHVKGKEYELGKAKNKLNAIYGMSATDCIRSVITYSKEKGFTVSDYESEITTKNLKRAPFPYQWGVWTTALARWKLHLAMRSVPRNPETGVSNLVYCDTDSIKTIGQMDLSALNKVIEETAYKMGAVAKDKNGADQPIGIWEDEEQYPAKSFVSQGSKRYCYIDKYGEMHIVVSGVSHNVHEVYDEDGNPVNKEDWKEWAVEELGDIENFRPGFIWYKAGGTSIVYNDNDDFIYEGEHGLPIHITKNASIIDVTYEMTRPDDYIHLINMCEYYLEYKKQFE